MDISQLVQLHPNSRLDVGRIVGGSGLWLDSTRHKLHISRRHCCLTTDSVGASLEDYGGVNGVHVNGLRLPKNSTHKLDHNDIIVFGDMMKVHGGSEFSYRFEAGCADSTPNNQPPAAATTYENISPCPAQSNKRPREDGAGSDDVELARQRRMAMEVKEAKEREEQAAAEHEAAKQEQSRVHAAQMAQVAQAAQAAVGDLRLQRAEAQVAQAAQAAQAEAREAELAVRNRALEAEAAGLEAEVASLRALADAQGASAAQQQREIEEAKEGAADAEAREAESRATMETEVEKQRMAKDKALQQVEVQRRAKEKEQAKAAAEKAKAKAAAEKVKEMKAAAKKEAKEKEAKLKEAKEKAVKEKEAKATAERAKAAEKKQAKTKGKGKEKALNGAKKSAAAKPREGASKAASSHCVFCHTRFSPNAKKPPTKQWAGYFHDAPCRLEHTWVGGDEEWERSRGDGGYYSVECTRCQEGLRSSYCESYDEFDGFDGCCRQGAHSADIADYVDEFGAAFEGEDLQHWKEDADSLECHECRRKYNAL
jgi:hypothetical protein